MDGVNIVQIRPEDVCDDMTIKTQHLTQRNNDVMSTSDLINFWQQTIAKWLISGNFEFESFCDICVTQNLCKISVS